MVYAAFVDNGDAANPSVLADTIAKYNPDVNLVGTEFQETFIVDNLRPGNTVVEVWVVLDKQVPLDVGGNVQARLVSASRIPSGAISTGNQTVPILKTQLFLGPPVANPDTNSVTEDATPNTATGNVLTNDTDVDVETLTVTQVNGAAGNVGTTINGTYGTLVVNANGTYAYTLNNANAAVNALDAGETLTDSFTYTNSDGTQTAGSTLTITIHGANDAPVAVNDVATTDQNTPVSVLTTPAGATSILFNDTDDDGEDLDVGSFTELTLASAPAGVTIRHPGTLTLDNETGTFTYTPSADFKKLAVGQSATVTFQYQATDGTADSNLATVTITVTGLNDPPVVENSNLNLLFNGGIIDEDDVVFLSGSFADLDVADTHTVTVAWGDGTTSNATVDPTTRTFTAQHQYLDDNPTGTPSDNYTVTVTVTDNHAASDTATAQVTVNNVAPVVNAGGNVTVQLGDSFNCPQGSFFDQGTLDTHSMVKVNWGDGTPEELLTVITDSGGSGTFGPFGHTYGDADTYTVTVTVIDDDGSMGTSTFTVTVYNGPVAVNDAYSVVAGNTLTVSAAQGVLTNDSGPAGATLTVAHPCPVRKPSFGTLTLDANGSFTYTAYAGFVGTDSFKYWITDGNSKSNIATVTITVTAPSLP